MARWATLVEIADVEFTGCRAELIDGQGFLSPVAGSLDWANDAKPHMQTFNRGIKGIPFGIQFVSVSQEALEELITEVLDQLDVGTSFRVKLTEGLYTIDVQAVPDYSVSPNWLTHGKHSEGWYENVTMRFVSKAIGG